MRTFEPKIGIKQIGLLGCTYCIIFLLFTWPLATDFTGSIVGNQDGEVYGIMWNVYIFKNNPSDFLRLHTSEVFAPLGTSLFLHSTTPLLSIFSSFFSNPILGVNLFIALNFILSGIGGFLLCRRYVSSTVLCVISGFLFAFSPYKMLRFEEHYNLILTAPVPFFILFFTRAFEFENVPFFIIKSKRDFYLCLLMGILALLSDYIIVLTIFFFCLLYFSWFKVKKYLAFNRKTFLIIAAFFVLGHIAVHLLKIILQEHSVFYWGCDLLSLVIPVNSYFFSQFIGSGYIEHIHHNSFEYVTYLGVTLIVLAIGSLFIKKPLQVSSEVNAFGVVAVILVILTMPQFKVNGVLLNYNPFSIVHFTPFIKNFRCPARYIMPVYLLLSIFAFYHLEKVSNVQIHILVAVLFLLEFFPMQVKMTKLDVYPSVYSSLKKLEGRTLLSVPFGVRDGMDQQGIFHTPDHYYQTIHQKKIIGGYISRVDPEVKKLYSEDKVMRNLLNLQIDSSYLPEEISSYELARFFNTFQPEIILITPLYKNSIVEDYLRKISEGKVLEEVEEGQHLILRLKKSL
ncbi:MAG: hypothetical protein ACK4ND_08255 [Cytophagaceae bacterium]